MYMRLSTLLQLRHFGDLCLYLHTVCVFLCVCWCAWPACLENTVFLSVIQYLYDVNTVADIISSLWLRCFSVIGPQIQVTQEHIQFEPTVILALLKRVGRHRPVFRDPLTWRHLVVLARS